MSTSNLLGELTEQELQDLVSIVNSKQSHFYDLGVMMYTLMTQRQTRSQTTVVDLMNSLGDVLRSEEALKLKVVERLQIAEGVNWGISADGKVVNLDVQIPSISE